MIKVCINLAPRPLRNAPKQTQKLSYCRQCWRYFFLQTLLGPNEIYRLTETCTIFGEIKKELRWSRNLE